MLSGWLDAVGLVWNVTVIVYFKTIPEADFFILIDLDNFE